MTFNDPTLYARDEEEEFGDSGAYSESLEEDFEEKEEEEESGPPPGEINDAECIPGLPGAREGAQSPQQKKNLLKSQRRKKRRRNPPGKKLPRNLQRRRQSLL